MTHLRSCPAAIAAMLASVGSRPGMALPWTRTVAARWVEALAGFRSSAPLRGLLILVLLMPADARAQVALYGVQPPGDAAFVRFANASAAPLAVDTDAAPRQRLGLASQERVSPYVVVDRPAAPGLLVVARQGDATLKVTVPATPGSVATVLFVTGQDGRLSASVVADQAGFDQSRARLAFYNATPACDGGTLTLLPQGAAVFAALAPGTVRMRSVMPVEARLQAGCANAAAPDVALSGLVAGGSYSVWLMLPDVQPLAFVTRDTMLPYER